MQASVHLSGSSYSGNCYKLQLLCEQVNLNYQWHEVDVLSGETRSLKFLAKNPNGKVPIAEWPDGWILTESNAILLHLSEGTRIWPEHPRARAQVYQWLFFEQYSHEPYIAVARFLKHIAKTADQQPERMAGLYEGGEKALSVMEAHLAAKPFFAGDYSVADIALFAYTHVADQGGFDLTSYPAVRDWLKRVKEQPGFVAMKVPDGN